MGYVCARALVDVNCCGSGYDVIAAVADEIAHSEFAVLCAGSRVLGRFGAIGHLVTMLGLIVGAVWSSTLMGRRSWRAA